MLVTDKKVIVKNIKTGKHYYFMGTAINATNKDDGTSMALYMDIQTKEMYTREIKEFNTKFVKS